MIRFRSRLATPLALASLLLPLGAPAPGGAQTRFEDTTDVVVVEIPVEVTRDGQPVRGLTADDFEVVEGRKRHDLVGFEVFDLTVTQDAPAAAQDLPVSARRHFLLLFDLAMSYPASVVKARQAALDLVERSLHPSDLVAVAIYSPTRGAQLLLGFTSDRDQVAVAIRTLGLPQLIQASPDPLGIMFADREAFPNFGDDGSGGAGPAGVDADAEIRELLETIETQAGRAQETNKILALTGSLGELAQMMGAIDGRKHVVYLSEGFDSSLLLGTGVSSQEEQRQIVEQNQAAMSGEVWRVDSQTRFGDTSTLNQLEQMAQEFVRADCTIQAVDIGGLRAGGDARARRPSDDGLYMMADKTGGEHYRNFNDLSQAMGRMLQRTSVTYLLAIQPRDLKLDGGFHRIKVKVKDDKGLRLAHRPGYFAPKPAAQAAPLEQRLRTAGLVLGGRDGGQIDTAVLAAPFLIAESRAYVPVLLEIDGESLMAGNADKVLPAEIYAYAIESDGSVRDFFTQAMGLELAKVEAALRRSGFKFWGQFELPAGDYVVRTVVRNSLTGSVGVRSSRLEVPTADRSEPALSPPFFPEPPGKWLLGKQQGADEAGYDYPFVMGSQAYIPAARPVVRAGQASQVELVGYNLGDGELVLSARLLDLAGAPVGGVAMALESRAPGSVPGQERLTARFRAGDVAAGHYTLEVTVGDPGGGSGATLSSIPVVVTG